MAERDLFSLLPSDWGTYDPYEKINWFNTNQVGSDELLATGAVSQGDIDWMLSQGYVGDYTPAPIAPAPIAPAPIAPAPIAPAPIAPAPIAPAPIAPAPIAPTPTWRQTYTQLAT